MELLLPAVITLLGELYKKLQTKFGDKTKSYVLIVVFLMSLVGTGIYEYFKDGLDLTDVGSLMKVWGLAIGYYEIVVKKLLSPLFSKFTS